MTDRSPANRPFDDVLRVRLSRRGALVGSLGAAATGFLATGWAPSAGAAGGPSAGAGTLGGPLVGFTPIPLDSGPVPMVSPDYDIAVLIPWGTPIQPGGPAFSYPPTEADQVAQVGIGHDGMWFFADGGSNSRGVLCINHEFGSNGHVYGKPAPETLADVRTMQAAMGVSVVELEATPAGWGVAAGGRSRRIHVNTPMAISGPVAGHPLLANAAGNEPAGTLNNCANGYTPWGTYLTCEENFNGYFGSDSPFTPTPEQARYGFSAGGFGYAWHTYDPRFDLNDPAYVGEHRRFGWVVEIDPQQPGSAPVKRTALGRVKHEGAAVTVGRGGRAVAYMGDDERFDYIYKFVSDSNWKSMRARGMSPLDHGRLYAARFDDDGTGEWLELTISDPALADRFSDQAEVLTYARIAADILGATPMDRPEWTTVAPNGDVYCTLTNNSRRGNAGLPGADAANPLAPNPNGHIIRWRDADRHVGTTFEWDIFVIAEEDGQFGSPDGLWADGDGRLFIQTDGGQPGGANDQMLVADTSTGAITRLFTGVAGGEVTGIAVTPDRRTMFLNVQHPANGDPAVSNWPGGPGDVPRDATVVLTRKDGGVIGS